MLSLSRMAAAGESSSHRAGSLLETELLRRKRSAEDEKCHTVQINSCFGGAEYSASLNVPELATTDEAKQGLSKVFELLPMAFSLLGGGGSAQAKIDEQLPKISSMLCSAVLPPCTSTCVPQKSCEAGCLDIQTTV